MGTLFLVFFFVGGFLQAQEEVLPLPEVHFEESSLGDLIFYRRSLRSFKEGFLQAEDLSYLLFAGLGTTIDGVTGATRAVPSAGATNPLINYVYLHQVEGFEKGLYRYLPLTHELECVLLGDFSRDLSSMALNQSSLSGAQLVMIITADYARTTGRYGERGIRYVHFEAGHGAQNILLMAEELGLGSVIIGAFSDEGLKKAFSLKEDPLLLIPIGLP